MAQKEFVAPSGLKGIVKGLKLNQLKMFNDRKGIKTGKIFDDIIQACLVEITDLGPAYKAAGRVDWGSTALQGDKTAVLVAIRRATHGDAFDFSITCPDRDCRAKISWEVDLVEELPMQPYPDEAIAAHLARRPFEVTLFGRRVTFGLITSADEKQMIKFIEQHKDVDKQVSALAYRCKTIEGIENKKTQIDWLGELDLGDVIDFRAALDATAGGYETTFEIECAECHATTEVELPLGGKDFWIPKKKGTMPTTSQTTSSSGASSSDQNPTDGSAS